MRYFESIMPHLRMAEKPDVKTALEVVAARNSNGWTKTPDGEMWMGPSMPKSWYWNPALSTGPNTQFMDASERRDYWTAWGKTVPKFAHQNKGRFV